MLALLSSQVEAKTLCIAPNISPLLLSPFGALPVATRVLAQVLGQPVCTDLAQKSFCKQKRRATGIPVTLCSATDVKKYRSRNYSDDNCVVREVLYR